MNVDEANERMRRLHDDFEEPTWWVGKVDRVSRHHSTGFVIELLVTGITAIRIGMRSRVGCRGVAWVTFR